MMVVCALTCCTLSHSECDSKVVAQMTEQRSLIWNLMFYELEINHKTAEATKDISFPKGEGEFGWLFGFYGISTFVGHSTPNSVYIYIHIQPKISKRILRLVEFSISRISFVCTRLTSFKLSYFLVQLCLSQEGRNVIYFDVLGQIG